MFNTLCLASRIDERIRELDLQLRLNTQSAEIAAFVQVLCLSLLILGGGCVCVCVCVCVCGVRACSRTLAHSLTHTSVPIVTDHVSYGFSSCWQLPAAEQQLGRRRRITGGGRICRCRQRSSSARPTTARPCV